MFNSRLEAIYQTNGSEVPQPGALKLGLPISTQSGTVLFVFWASRFMRQRLIQQVGIGLTQRHRQTSAFHRCIFWRQTYLELRLCGQPAGACLFPELC